VQFAQELLEGGSPVRKGFQMGVEKLFGECQERVPVLLN
jgi:hypothetical protein